MPPNTIVESSQRFVVQLGRDKASGIRREFEWIARDVQTNRAGFPDLVQFWPQQRRYRLIEVKGPGDRLQDNQRRLLEYCVQHQMPVSVCHVHWANR